MKRNLFVFLSAFLMSSFVFAAKTQPIGIKDATFNPVAWHATMANGGFGLQNQTNKIQYVQVNVDRGKITVFTLVDGKIGDCRQDLDAEHGPFSVVCELAPKQVLSADIDFAEMAEASGTYQVEMDR